MEDFVSIVSQVIPSELRQVPQWVCWRYVDKGGPKPTKPPYQVNGQLASVDDPGTWNSFENTLAAYKAGGFDGIGFVLTPALGIVGLDLDGCIDDDGTIQAWAIAIVERLDTYTEISPSGHGLRLLAYGKLPPSGRKKGPFECYAEGRYLTFTGHVLGDSPKPIAKRQVEITAIHGEMFGTPKLPPKRQPSAPTNLDDDAVLAKACAAKNGAEFQRLWNGDFAAYPSQSEADLALASHLGFWTGGDARRVDALFRRSGLFRDKWDEPRGDSTYGQVTIAKALDSAVPYVPPPSANGSTPSSVQARHARTEEGDQLHLTDLGNARRLVALHGQDFHYVYPFGHYLVWEGTRWVQDDRGRMQSWAKDAALGIYAEAADLYRTAAELESQGQKENAKEVHAKAQGTWKWARQSEAAPRIQAMLELTKSESGVPVTPGQLDADPWLLNVQNGVIDLHTGKLRPHSRADLITKLAPVGFDRDAHLDLWDSFIQAAVPDDAQRTYLQKFVGMALSGDSSEDLLFFAHGVGGSGKGTFAGAIMAALGPDYATASELETFTSAWDGHAPQPDMARLRGMRLVVIEEVDDRSYRAMGQLKKASGGTPITTRGLHQASFTFIPQFKLLLVGNKQPGFPDDDKGLWRRLRVLPFIRKFEPPDPSVRQRLTNPALAGAAVLAWAYKGFQAWQTEGMVDLPTVVRQATGAYQDDLDPLRGWRDDNTHDDPEAWVSTATLYQDYVDWARDGGVRRPLRRETFGKRLSERYKPERRHEGRGFTGIALGQVARDGCEPSRRYEPPVFFPNESSHVGKTWGKPSQPSRSVADQLQPPTVMLDRDDQPSQPSQPSRCPTCGGTDFWQRPDGGWVCSICHPGPANRG